MKPTKCYTGTEGKTHMCSGGVSCNTYVFSRFFRQKRENTHVLSTICRPKYKTHTCYEWSPKVSKHKKTQNNTFIIHTCFGFWVPTDLKHVCVIRFLVWEDPETHTCYEVLRYERPRNTYVLLGFGASFPTARNLNFFLQTHQCGLLLLSQETLGLTHGRGQQTICHLECRSMMA